MSTRAYHLQPCGTGCCRLMLAAVTAQHHGSCVIASQDLPGQPPSPWTLTESPGDSRLTLTRQHGDETVEVCLVADEVRLLVWTAGNTTIKIYSGVVVLKRVRHLAAWQNGGSVRLTVRRHFERD